MNNGSWLPEDDFPGFSDVFFDDFIKYIDFPLEDVETANDEGDWDAGFQDLEPPPMDMLSGLSSEFACGGFSKGSHMGDQKALPVLKQSSSSEGSFSIESSVRQLSSLDGKVSRLFQSSSPVSVLENSNSSLSSKNSRSHRLVFSIKGTRSKRKRPTALKLRLFHFEPRKSQPSVSDESDSETYYPSGKPTKKKRKKYKMHPTHLSSSFSESKNSEGTIRKCTHCETTKTPQWREGPNGPKTLCNACGVRFRSGRLVPEYRPAASPTFIPSMHSNSHRKIIEMRRKSNQQFDTGMIHAVISRA